MQDRLPAPPSLAAKVIHAKLSAQLRTHFSAKTGLEERIFVAEYRIKLPSEERIKEGLDAFDRSADGA